MSLSTYALVTLEEVKAYIGAAGSAADPVLESCINRASAWIESETDRKFITRGAITEYHSVRAGDHSIRLAERPIVTVTSVHESSSCPPVYDAASLLTANTDYMLVKERGIIRRVSLGQPTPWLTGYRAIKVVYSYGYANQDSVPEDLRQLCLFVATSMFKESDRARWGLSSVTDALGTVTRFTGYLPPDMESHLAGYQRGLFERTHEEA